MAKVTHQEPSVNKDPTIIDTAGTEPDAVPVPTDETSGTARAEATGASAVAVRNGASQNKPDDEPPDPPGNGAPPAAPGRRFDPSRLRLSQDYVAMSGVKKQVLVVPIRKPTKHEWVQFHPEESWRIEVASIVYKEERETHYVVDSSLWPNLTAEIVPMLLVATISTQGAFFLTPIRLPGPDGRHNEWHRSLLEAAQLGMKGNWIRVAANQSVGGYEVYSAAGDLGPAPWPATTFVALLEIALRDRLIDTLDHPILKRLRGES
jgi:hypothetical protein